MPPAVNKLYPEGTTMTTVSSGGRRKCHYTLPDESEAIEEYDLQTDELLVRKKRGKTVLGALQEWVYEVGEAPSRVTIENDMLRPSNVNPVLVRKDRPHAFEWRVRNLSYPKPTYNVTVDTDANQIVVRRHPLTAKWRAPMSCSASRVARAAIRVPDMPCSTADPLARSAARPSSHRLARTVRHASPARPARRMLCRTVHATNAADPHGE